MGLGCRYVGGHYQYAPRRWLYLGSPPGVSQDLVPPQEASLAAPELVNHLPKRVGYDAWSKKPHL